LVGLLRWLLWLLRLLLLLLLLLLGLLLSLRLRLRLRLGLGLGLSLRVHHLLLLPWRKSARLLSRRETGWTWVCAQHLHLRFKHTWRGTAIGGGTSCHSITHGRIVQ
jgi:hypothetical protein